MVFAILDIRLSDGLLSTTSLPHSMKIVADNETKAMSERNCRFRTALTASTVCL